MDSSPTLCLSKLYFDKCKWHCIITDNVMMNKKFDSIIIKVHLKIFTLFSKSASSNLHKFLKMIHRGQTCCYTLHFIFCNIYDFSQMVLKSSQKCIDSTSPIWHKEIAGKLSFNFKRKTTSIVFKMEYDLILDLLEVDNRYLLTIGRGWQPTVFH